MLFILVSISITCSEYPTELKWSNPIDPANPVTKGDPYNLRASKVETGISLMWDSVGLPQLTGYRLYRGVDEDDFLRLLQTSATTTNHTDTTVLDGHQYEYYVVAVCSYLEVERADTSSVKFRTDPFLVIEGDSSYTPTINVNLTIMAFGAEMMLLSNSLDTTGATWEPARSTKQWQLETELGTKNVYLYVVYSGGDTSMIVSDQIEPTALSPTIAINNGDTHTSTRSVRLALSAFGATELQLSNSAFLGDIIWQAFSDTVNWELTEGVGVKRVYAKVRNDFLIEADATCQINASELNPTIVINDGDTHTATRSVQLSLSSIGAIEMQLSNEPFQGDESWEPFSDAVEWELSTGAGVKTVYANVRNDFLIDADFFDQIEPAALSPTLVINDGDTHTSTRSVQLLLSAVGATEMQLSDEPFQGDESWEPFSEAVDWELTTGAGVKTVYANVRNDFLIEGDVSDQIEPTTLNPSLVINHDEEITNDSDLHLSMLDVGALEMQVSELDNFSNVEWIDYEGEIDFKVEDGSIVIHARFRHEFFETDPISDSVIVDTQVEIEEFTWSADEYRPYFIGDLITFHLVMSEDANGEEVDGTALVSIDDFSEIIELEDVGGGIYEFEYEILDKEWIYEDLTYNSEVSISFTDRADNQTQSNAEDLINIYPSSGFEHEFILTGDADITMVFIPPGQFVMGSHDDEDERSDDESPAHQVTFLRGFWLGKYEVTQGQWEAVMRENPAHDYGVGDDHPVYFVSWDDIQGFESALDNVYRLPSESEWEYACRAGTETRFYWGDDPDHRDIRSYAIFNGNEENGTAEVGSKVPNYFGLYDMSGNVGEWCEDRWHNNYVNAPEDGAPWLVQPVGSGRVHRGGSWDRTARSCRSARRGNYEPSTQNNILGFRLIKSR